MFEMKVEAVNLPYGDFIMDADYWVAPQDFESGKRNNRYAQFRLIRRFKSESLHLDSLMAMGLKAAPQSPQANFPRSLLEYIQSQL